MVLQRELPLLVPLPLGSQQVASRQVASLLVLRQQEVPQLGPREVQVRSYSTVSVWFIETTSYPGEKTHAAVSKASRVNRALTALMLWVELPGSWLWILLREFSRRI